MSRVARSAASAACRTSASTETRRPERDVPAQPRRGAALSGDVLAEVRCRSTADRAGTRRSRLRRAAPRVPSAAGRSRALPGSGLGPGGWRDQSLLHLSLHLAIASQLAIDQPAGIVEFDRLRAARRRARRAARGDRLSGRNPVAGAARARPTARPTSPACAGNERLAPARPARPSSEPLQSRHSQQRRTASTLSSRSAAAAPGAAARCAQACATHSSYQGTPAIQVRACGESGIATAGLASPCRHESRVGQGSVAPARARSQGRVLRRRAAGGRGGRGGSLRREHLIGSNHAFLRVERRYFRRGAPGGGPRGGGGGPAPAAAGGPALHRNRCVDGASPHAVPTGRRSRGW